MFETIQKVSRSRDTLVRSAMRQILRNGGQELLWLADFHKSETAIQAVLPNLDGLYGGKPCVRKIDNSKAANITKNISYTTSISEQLTVRGDNDPNFDPNYHWNQIAQDGKQFWDQCEEAIVCDWKVNTHQKGSSKVYECERYTWTGLHPKLFR